MMLSPWSLCSVKDRSTDHDYGCKLSAVTKNTVSIQSVKITQQYPVMSMRMQFLSSTVDLYYETENKVSTQTPVQNHQRTQLVSKFCYTTSKKHSLMFQYHIIKEISKYPCSSTIPLQNTVSIQVPLQYQQRARFDIPVPYVQYHQRIQ